MYEEWMKDEHNRSGDDPTYMYSAGLHRWQIRFPGATEEHD